MDEAAHVVGGAILDRLYGRHSLQHQKQASQSITQTSQGLKFSNRPEAPYFDDGQYIHNIQIYVWVWELLLERQGTPAGPVEDGHERHEIYLDTVMEQRPNRPKPGPISSSQGETSMKLVPLALFVVGVLFNYWVQKNDAGQFLMISTGIAAVLGLGWSFVQYVLTPIMRTRNRIFGNSSITFYSDLYKGDDE